VRKKNPPIWKKIVKFGSREKNHLYGKSTVNINLKKNLITYYYIG